MEWNPFSIEAQTDPYPIYRWLRDEIVRATRRVILEHGLGGVTMRSIAAETGKSTGLINHYFDD